MEPAISTARIPAGMHAEPTVAELTAVCAASRQRAYHIALHLTGDASEAEDLVQEAQLRARRSLPRFRGDSSLQTWLLRILVNLCLKSLRYRAFRRRVRHLLVGQTPSGPATPEYLAGCAEDARRLAVALTDLSPQQRAAFLLRHAHDLPLAEVAAVLDVSVETAKTHLARAVRHLRVALAEKPHD
jgi:RNA polymerase sigma-70 factor (ECF subfamily)